MTRLESARAEYHAALAEERDRILAELARLGEDPTAGDAPPQQTRSPKKLTSNRKAHGVPGAPGKLSDGSKTGAGDKTCKECGRKELKGQPGPGGHLRFHYAPECELPCAGANLKTVAKEDLAGGVHSMKACPKCKRVAYK